MPNARLHRTAIVTIANVVMAAVVAAANVVIVTIVAAVAVVVMAAVVEPQESWSKPLPWSKPPSCRRREIRKFVEFWCVLGRNLLLSPSRSDLVVQSCYFFCSKALSEIYNLGMVSGPVLKK